MLNIGCHLSSAKGYLHMGEEALALGANTFQFFTRNPRGGRAKAIDTEDIRALLALMRENSFAPLLAHAPYTIAREQMAIQVGIPERFFLRQLTQVK